MIRVPGSIVAFSRYDPGHGSSRGVVARQRQLQSAAIALNPAAIAPRNWISLPDAAVIPQSSTQPTALMQAASRAQ